MLESLENLRKNGRLTKLQAVVTGALRIKLLMGATPQGEICKLGQALTMKQALGKLVDRMAADPDHQGFSNAQRNAKMYLYLRFAIPAHSEYR